MAMVFGNESNMRKSANVPPSKNLFVHLGKALTRLRQRMSNLNIARNSVTVAMLMYVAGVAVSDRRWINRLPLTEPETYWGCGRFRAIQAYDQILRRLLQ